MKLSWQRPSGVGIDREGRCHMGTQLFWCSRDWVLFAPFPVTGLVPHGAPSGSWTGEQSAREPLPARWSTEAHPPAQSAPAGPRAHPHIPPPPAGPRPLRRPVLGCSGHCPHTGTGPSRGTRGTFPFPRCLSPFRVL